MSRFRNHEPVFIAAKFRSVCGNSLCSNTINKGDIIPYFPVIRRALCPECGNQRSRDIAAADFDQAVYDNQSANYQAEHR